MNSNGFRVAKSNMKTNIRMKQYIVQNVEKHIPHPRKLHKNKLPIIHTLFVKKHLNMKVKLWAELLGLISMMIKKK